MQASGPASEPDPALKAKSSGKGKAKAKAKASAASMKRPAAAIVTPQKRPAARVSEDEFSDAPTLVLGEDVPEEKKGEKKSKTKTEKKKQEPKSKSEPKGPSDSKKKEQKPKSDREKEGIMKRPAAADSDVANRKVSNVYFYKKSNIWGVKVNGKEAFAVWYSFLLGLTLNTLLQSKISYPSSLGWRASDSRGQVSRDRSRDLRIIQVEIVPLAFSCLFIV